MKHVNQFTYIDLFTPQECEDILHHMNSEPKSKGRVLNNKKGSITEFFTRRCDLAWVPLSIYSSWYFLRIQNKIAELNKRWLQFELDGNMEDLQYLDYGFGGFYDKHTDNSSDAVATRKLTCVIQLSPSHSYRGGHLKIDSNTVDASGNPLSYGPRKQGTAIIFPSHLPHTATPVWWGRRKALVAWFHGKHPLK